MEQPKPSEYDSKKSDILLQLSEESETLKNYFLARRQKGIDTYGTPLQPFNGRDARQDLMEEILDACAYARQIHLEEPSPLNLKTSLIMIDFAENLYKFLNYTEVE